MFAKNDKIYSKSFFADKFHVVKVIQFSFFYLCFLLTYKYNLGINTYDSTRVNPNTQMVLVLHNIRKKKRQKRKLQHHKNKVLLPHRISLSSKPIACYKLYLVKAHTVYEFIRRPDTLFYDYYWLFSNAIVSPLFSVFCSVKLMLD